MPKLNRKYIDILRNIKDDRPWWAIPSGNTFRASKRPSEAQADMLERLIRGGYVDRNVTRQKLLALTKAGRIYATNEEVIDNG